MTTAFWKDFWGSTWRRTNPYGKKSPWWDPTLYTKGYHRGEDIANKGLTCEVPALRTGEIIDTGRSRQIGHWVCIKPDADPARRDIYCHMYEGTGKKSGRVKAGQIIGRTAGKNENPGSGWKGPHLHFVVSTGSYGGFDTSMPDYDPRPIIKNALANPTTGTPTGGSGSTPNKANARTVRKGGKPINGRSKPTTDAPIKQKLNPGTTGAFDAFIRGEKINGNSIWYRGAVNGNWFWSGNFTTKSAKGLKDLGTYKPATPAKREYVRLSATWYYYKSLANALKGNYASSQRVGKGDYLVVKKDSRGPVQIKTKYGNVWVGTRNTKPTIIKK